MFCETASRRRILLGALALAAPAGGARADERETRTRALSRGLEAIYRAACRPAEFAKRGDDFLWCFDRIAATSADPKLGERARRLGVERARVWRRTNGPPGRDFTVEQLFKLISGADCCDELLGPDRRMHAAIARACSQLTAEDALGFDPVEEPPPTDLPKTCARCGRDNVRGAVSCARCGAKLEMLDRSRVLMAAMIASYSGERYGVVFGARFADVCGRLGALRPYRGYAQAGEAAYWSTAYYVTHIVYTLNDYGVWRLKPEWLPQEYAFLRANLAANIARGDPELMGEFVDSLLMFGLDPDDPLIRQGRSYLLATQNPDGGWGDGSAYHPTWTAVNGLRDLAFRGDGAFDTEALARARS